MDPLNPGAPGAGSYTITCVGTLDIVTARDNIVFLGPATGRTYLAIGWRRAC